ncbi:MAG: alpha/beta hydrolase fold domain-containing protein [Kiritimatiellales bacterium]|nr:alpha/beta hydrolase fold domain-containing protein [Kiritimatiellales bacterium]
MTKTMLVAVAVMLSLYTNAFEKLAFDKTIPYKQVAGAKEAAGNTLTLEVFLPKNHDPSKRVPCAVFFFGGGWSGGSTSQFHLQAKYLASRGMVAICADYRTKKSHDAQPFQCLEDAKSAVRYVRAHAAELGIDPDKIAAGGGSAGGHLAAASSMCLEKFNAPTDDMNVSPVANALLLFNPVYDNGPEGYGHERVAEYYKDISPMHNIRSGTPPTIVFFGDHDVHVPVATVEKYKALMEQAGSRCETFVYKDQTHGFFNLKKGGPEMFIQTVTEMDRFLVSLGFLEGEPTIKEWTASNTAQEAAPEKKQSKKKKQRKKKS